MGIFLGVKQIVDVLYQFKILDVIMVLIAMGMMAYAIVKDKIYENFTKKIAISDILIVVLGILYFFSFLRNTNGRNQFVKTEAAFLVYFLGRMYANRFINAIGYSRNAENKGIRKYIYGTDFIALSAYVVLYANFVVRLVKIVYWKKTGIYLGNELLDVYADGGLYYYKTDLTLGVAIMVMLIYVFSNQKVFKWFSIIPIALITAFMYSNGRSGQVVLLLTYSAIFIWEVSNLLLKIRNRKYKENNVNIENDVEGLNKSLDKCARKDKTKYRTKATRLVINIAYLLIIVILTVLFIFIQRFDLIRVNYEDIGLAPETFKRIESIFHGRQLSWWNAMGHFSEQPLLTRLTGIDLISESTCNYRGIRFHTTYVKLIYSIGYIGTYCFWTWMYFVMKSFVNLNASVKKQRLVKEQSNKLESVKSSELESTSCIIQLFVLFGVMFLFMSFCMESFEYAQMSWMPMIFTGMVVSIEKKLETRDC